MVKEISEPTAEHSYRVNYSFRQSIFPNPPRTQLNRAFYEGSRPNQQDQVAKAFKRDFKIYKPTILSVEYLIC